MNTPDNTTQSDELDEIVQQMLVDYTAWVNGEPTPWNVKKAEAKQKLLAWRDAAVKQAVAEVRKDQIMQDFLSLIAWDDPDLTENVLIDWRMSQLAQLSNPVLEKS